MDENGPSDDLLMEQAYLIERGVRPVALIGSTGEGLDVAREMATRLKILAAGTAITFMLPGSYPGSYTYGYASHAWVVDLLRWVLSDECPDRHGNRILGLLLGYSADAIRSFEELGSGQRAIWSPTLESSSRPSCTLDNRGTCDSTAP